MHVRFRLVGAALAAATLALPASAGGAGMPQPAQLHAAQTAWPGSPCTNRVHVYWDRTLLARYGFVGAASGIHAHEDGSWHRVSCDIALDVGYWLAAGAYERCQILVHEAGHLAGLHHTATGIMSPGHDGTHPACGHYI